MNNLRKVRKEKGLSQLNLDLVCFAVPNIGYTHRKHKILIDLIYATKGAVKGEAHIVNLEKYEKSKGKLVSDHHPVEACLEL